MLLTYYEKKKKHYSFRLKEKMVIDKLNTDTIIWRIVSFRTRVTCKKLHTSVPKNDTCKLLLGKKIKKIYVSSTSIMKYIFTTTYL